MTHSPIPNPYTRQPIKQQSQLAGRTSELSDLDYYFSLTAAGQSPHVALIGERGVGKTSLLNAAEAIAREKQLLVIRCDLTERSASSSGRFWYEFYSALVEQAARQGCWGGRSSAIYAALFGMLFGRTIPPLDMVVLQFPYALASYRGDIDAFECPASLLVSDITNLIETELNAQRLRGMVVLVDEADCLSLDKALLQSLRNVFQRTDRASLVCAGTDAIFPALSEVFSPIPRQFHRLDVGRFLHRMATRELIEKPLKKHKELLPSRDTVIHLHELCSGDPAELQLYCHHMYRAVERGLSNRMTLMPAVFREVLHEYRSHASGASEGVLTAIESLPTELLLGSPWLRMRNLSADEMIQHQILTQELRTSQLLAEEEQRRAELAVRESLGRLKELNISSSDDRLELVGTPLTAGYWKSYVEFDKKRRWRWIDDDFSTAKFARVTDCLVRECGGTAVVSDEVQDAGDIDALTALQRLRTGKPVADVAPSSTGRLFEATLIGREMEVGSAVDMRISLAHAEKSRTRRISVFKLDSHDVAQRVQALQDKVRAVLEKHGISLKLEDLVTWELPTNEEAHRVARLSRMPTPAGFGPSPSDKALAAYNAGDLDATIAIFRALNEDKPEPNLHNSIAFCLLLKGDAEQALGAAESAVLGGFRPLCELNLSIALWLNGRREECADRLWGALQRLRLVQESGGDLVAVHVLSPDVSKVIPDSDLSVTGAIVINLVRVGRLSESEASTLLKELSGSSSDAWLKRYFPVN